MRSLTHFLRSSMASLNEQTLTVPSAIVNYFPSSVFPERRPRKRKKKKKHFLCCGRFQFLLVAFRNTETTAKQDFSVKTKHQSLTSLAYMRLVPGDNRAVRYICIRCITSTNTIFWGECLSLQSTSFKLHKTSSFQLGWAKLSSRSGRYLSLIECYKIFLV